MPLWTANDAQATRKFVSLWKHVNTLLGDYYLSSGHAVAAAAMLVASDLSLLDVWARLNNKGSAALLAYFDRIVAGAQRHCNCVVRRGLISLHR